MRCDHDTYVPPPCENCGRKPGYSSFSWLLGRVCSERCGKRLTARVRNGMVTAPPNMFDTAATVRGAAHERIHALRVRIKSLEHRLAARASEEK